MVGRGTELVELSPELVMLLVGFGFIVSVFFGFFRMGRSFFVTPALLILDYFAPVAVGFSMAFIFGTAVIATLKHHDVGSSLLVTVVIICYRAVTARKRPQTYQCLRTVGTNTWSFWGSLR